MSKNYIQKGDVVDHLAGSNISSGAVVKMVNTIGVARADIASGATGPVAVQGTYYVPKVAGRAWVAGEKLFWDVSTSSFDTTAGTLATGDVTGCAVVQRAAASADTSGYVKLTPGNTAIT